ncbi:MAG: hypothetical protein ACO35Q_11330, partial [Prochlorothrix sp.]
MAMQAIEFTTAPHDGVIDLPEELRHWSGHSLRVIILLDQNSAVQPTIPRSFPDLTAFRSSQPPAHTTSAQLLRSLREE